jgi:citrate lyase subunit beta / citryl-CoA lyase
MPEPRTPPPRRSCLVVPAVPRMLAKLEELRADEIVIDLEDAVPASGKAEARERAAAALGQVGEIGPAIAVRINPVGSEWWEADIEALFGAARPPGSVVVPKVEGASDLAAVDGVLAGLKVNTEPVGSVGAVGVQALIETAAGVARADELAGSGPWLEALIIGYADLAASLGRSAAAAADPKAWSSIQDRVLVAARAAGAQAIDGPHLGVSDDSRFRDEAAHARGLGFDGKWAIHPRQAPALEEVFSPTDEETARAKRIVSELERTERGGEGALALDGEMIDEASRKHARRVLAMAERSGR